MDNFSTVILISGLSFVVSLFAIPLRETMPWGNRYNYLTYISTMIDDSTEIFNNNLILNVKISIIDIAIIGIFKNLIILFHNSVIIILVLLVFQINLTINIFFIFYGFIIILINSFSVTIIFGILCLRYRDFILIIKNLLYLLFLMFPIFWTPSVLTDNRIILADINILYQIIQTIRDPLLGNSLSTYNLIYTFIFSIVFFIFVFLYSKNLKIELYFGFNNE